MQIGQTTFYILQALIFLVVVGIAALAIFYFFGSGNVNNDGADAANKAKIERLRASAGIYFDRLQFYDGVCSDIGVPGGFECNNNEQAYAVSVRLNSGGFYCADSTGFVGRNNNALRGDIQCSQ